MISWYVWVLPLYLATWLTIPHVLLTNKRPASMLLWIGGTVFVPFFTPALYLFIGTDRMRRRRLKRHRHASDAPGGMPPGSEAIDAVLDAPEKALVQAVSEINRIPPSAISSLELLHDADSYYPEVFKDLKQAQDHVHWVVYVWRDDEIGRRFLDHLVDAARRGVEVRLLVDELGSVETSESFFQPLVEAGGQFSWFYTIHPRRNRYFLNLRNHRKLLIVDGRIAYVGGMNVGLEYMGRDESVGEWRDLQICVRGPVLRSLQEIFRNDWYFATNREFSGNRYYPEPEAGDNLPALLVESGPDSMRKPFLKTCLALCQHARERIDLFTPYFVPVPSLVHAMQIAAARGVRVRLMVSEKNDHRFLVHIGRSYYEELMDFGVEIYEYSEAVHHAKVVLADGQWIMVGSANLDARSFDLNFELNVLLRSESKGRALDKHYDPMFASSDRLDPGPFARRPRRQKMVEGLSRIWAPLL